MKRLILYLACALAWSSACAEAKVQWLRDTYDFGAFGEDEQVGDAVFEMVNLGPDEVAIVSAAANCGCTVPSYSKDMIAPGDTARVTVRYNAAGRPGRFNKSVYVRTSNSPERTCLKIKGIVIGNEATIGRRYPKDMGPLKLRDQALMMGRVAAGKSKSEFFEGYNQSNQPITPTFANLPKYLSVTATPPTVEPGDMVSFAAYLRADRCKEWGLITDSLQICPTGNGGPCYWLPVTAIIEEDFSNLTPEQRAAAPSLAIVGDRIDLGNVPPSATKPVIAKIKIANVGKSPLKIRKIYSSDPAVKVKAKALQIKPGKEAEIKVEFDPAASAASIINTRITIITNDPSAPTRPIRIVGTRN